MRLSPSESSRARVPLSWVPVSWVPVSWVFLTLLAWSVSSGEGPLLQAQAAPTIFENSFAPGTPPAAPNAEWVESKLGTIPNSFGQLFTVAGDANQYSLVFQNARHELRLILVPGSKLRRKVLLIDRVASPTSTEDSPESGSKEKSGGGTITEENWTVELVGSIPDRFGSLLAVSGNRGKGGGYTFVFSDDEQNVRLVIFSGNRLQKKAFLYTVEPVAPTRAPADSASVHEKRTSKRWVPEPDGWTDVSVGSIPEHFGTLIAASSSDQRTTLAFQAGFGELTIFDVQPGKAPKSARLILRTVPSKDELRGREQEDKELREQGFDWKISFAGVIPDAYGDLHRIDSQNQLSMIFQDPENQLRLIHLRGNVVQKELARIERPEQTFTKSRIDAEGWNETPIGAIPESFGDLRAVTGSRQSQLQLLCVFQGNAGEIRLIHRTGTSLPEKLSLIDIEY